MKLFKTIFSFFLLFSICQLSSCRHNTPVDQIVEILDQAAQKTKELQNPDELTNIRNVVSPDDVWNIIRENADYKLTDGDKDKLKDSFNKLISAAYDKSAEFVNDEDSKKMVKSQLDLMTKAIDNNIDRANTLGEIKSFNRSR